MFNHVGPDSVTALLLHMHERTPRTVSLRMLSVDDRGADVEVDGFVHGPYDFVTLFLKSGDIMSRFSVVRQASPVGEPNRCLDADGTTWLGNLVVLKHSFSDPKFFVDLDVDDIDDVVCMLRDMN